MIRCDFCQTEFVPYSRRTRFCCRQHSDAWFVRAKKVGDEVLRHEAAMRAEEAQQSEEHRA